MKSLKDRLPIPSRKIPYAQLWFLVDQYCSQFTLTKTIDNIKTSARQMQRCLIENNITSSDYEAGTPFVLEKHIGKSFLITYKEILLRTKTKDGNAYAGLTTAGFLSNAKKLVFYAYDHRLINSRPYDVPNLNVRQENLGNTAYSENEFDSIINAIKVEFKSISKFISVALFVSCALFLIGVFGF